MTEPDPPVLTGAPWTPEPGAIVFLPEPTGEGFTEEEAYAFLGRDKPGVYTSIPADSLTAAAMEHDGAMVALVPSEEDVKRLAIDGYEPPEVLHLTLHYLGEASLWNDEARKTLIDALQSHSWSGNIEGRAFGVAHWNPDSDAPCWVLNVGGDLLPIVHMLVDDTLSVLASESLIPEIPAQHQPWAAHIAIAYTDDILYGDLVDRLGPVTFDRLRVAFADDNFDIPLREGLVAADTAFHLPGKHDQRAHGRGGVGVPAEFAAAEKLNAGKKLNRNDPVEGQIGGAISSWTAGGAGATQVRYEMQQAAIDPDADTPGAALMRTIAASGANSPELYRGMHGVNPSDIPSQGDVIKLGPTSFTRSKSVREQFATPEDISSFGHNTSVNITLKKNSRSLRIDQEAADVMKFEKEHLTMGTFRVSKSSSRTVTMKATNGQKGKVTLFDLEFEQVSDDIAATAQTKESIVTLPGW